MNGSNNLDETYREYLMAPTDDWLDYGGQRSKVKVIAGCNEGIHVDAGASKYILVNIFL